MTAGLAIVLAGVCTISSAFPWEDLRFSRPPDKSLPRAVASWKSSCLHLDMVASAFTMATNDSTYIIISAGAKPASGYAVRVSRIERTAKKEVTVHALFTGSSPVVITTPRKGAGRTPNATRPYDLVAIPDTGWTVTVIPQRGPVRVATLAGTRNLPAIVKESRAIKLFSPRSGESVLRTIHVTGVALVYEGTVQIRLITGKGAVLVRTLTTAASGSDWGYFQKAVAVPDSVPRRTQMRLELFTMDEENGGETNLVRVPLILR